MVADTTGGGEGTTHRGGKPVFQEMLYLISRATSGELTIPVHTKLTSSPYINCWDMES